MNPLQYELFDAIRGQRSDVFVVGDPMQAIYGWNGSDKKLFDELPDKIRGTTVLHLPNNYRCSPQILAAAKSVAAHADHKLNAKSTEDLVIGGDFNIAPTDDDVWDVTKFEGATHVSAPERKAFTSLCEWGLTDVFRDLHPEPKVFSWWDYRNGSFHKGEGMRIDFLLATNSLAKRVKSSEIDRNARKGEKPSDHVPVMMTVEKKS